MKKTFAIISIILAICLVLGGCTGIDRISSGAYTEGERTVTDKIYKIDIDWAQGGVMIRSGKQAEGITVRESDTDGNQLATRIIGSVLYIRNAKPGKEAGEKTLIVIVPSNYNYREIEIRTDSANAALRNLKVSRADIETVSGNISVIGCDIDDEAELESETGVVTAVGNIADYDIKTKSGEVNITPGTIPEDLDAETEDGIIVANLPADIPSGSFKAKTDGNVTDKLTNKEKGEKYVFKSKTGNIFILEKIEKK